MNGRLRAWLLFLLLASGLSRAGAQQDSIAGIYKAEDGGHKIELFMAGSELRGRIVWTREKNLLDRHNKDPKLRSRRVVGLEHLRGLTHDADGAWTGGVLYNPEDGKSYDAKLWRRGEQLVIRGRPRIAVLGGLLGALFGKITYTREAAPP